LGHLRKREGGNTSKPYCQRTPEGRTSTSPPNLPGRRERKREVKKRKEGPISAEVKAGKKKSKQTWKALKPERDEHSTQTKKESRLA